MIPSKTAHKPKIYIYTGSDSLVCAVESSIDGLKPKPEIVRLKEFEDNTEYLKLSSEDPSVFIIDLHTDSDFNFLSKIREHSTDSQVIYVMYYYDDLEYERTLEQSVDEILVLGELARMRSTLQRTISQIYTPVQAKESSRDNLSCKIVTEYIQDAVIVTSTEGRITSFNRAAQQLFGYKPEEIIGQNISVIHPPESLGVSLPECVEIVRRDSIMVADTKVIRKDQSRIDIRLSINMIPDDDGNPVAMVGIARKRNLASHSDSLSNRLSQVVDFSDDAIIAIKIDGTVLNWNNGAKAMFGYEAEEVIGKPVSMIIPPERLTELPPIIYQLKRGEPIDHFQAQNITKDGRVLETSISISPFIDNEGNAVGAAILIRDLTSEKRAIEKSKQQLELLQRIIDTIPTPIYYKDSDLIYRMCNSAFAEIAGLDCDEIIGKSISDILPEELADVYHKYDMQLLEKGGRQSYEANMPGANGTTRNVEFNKAVCTNDDGKKLGIVGVMIDLGLYRNTSLETTDLEKRYRDVLSSAMEGIGIIDADKKVTYCNQALANILDANSPDEITGRSILDFIQKSQHDRLFSELGRHDRTGPLQLELEIISLKNKRKMLQFSTSASLDSEGRFNGGLAVFMDITELRQLREFAELAGRVEAAGRIAGQIALNFSNLLGPLMAYPELIKDELPKDHTAIPMLDDIEEAAQQISEINQQLLTLGRRGSHDIEHLNLNSIVEQSISQLTLYHEKITIEKNLSPDITTIDGERPQIYRVLNNIITNAIEATGGTGTISITTGSRFVTSFKGIFGIIPAGDYVTVAVSDSGPGISENLLSRIFDPFFTTKTALRKKGSGLGLSIVNAVVKDHKGYINCNTTKGEGTTFTLYFPVSSSTSEKTCKTLHRENKGKIMVVDDDPIQRNVMQTLLTRLHYDVTTASSGEEAVKLASDTQFDLAILDVIMPGGIDGVETYRQMKEFNPDQKAIILSGFAYSDRVELAAELGIGQFIRKPVTLETLSQAVYKEISREQNKTSEKTVH